MMRGWLLFGAGILLAAIGAGLVLYSKGSLDAAARLKVVAPAIAQAPTDALEPRQS